MQTISQILAQELNCKQEYIENVIALLDEGNTIPFIARYRKEQHGAMDDTALRTLETRLQYLRNLAQRREEVKSSIEAQEKLTDELAKAIDEAKTLAEVEDLYRPYKPKRRTRATIAKEKGLEPLADAIFAQTLKMDAPEMLAQAYIDPEKGVETIEDALTGASDILAERISDDAEVRKSLRALMNRRGTAQSAAAKDEEDEKTAVYRQYFEFSQPISRLQSHQVLALNRGEREGALKVSLAVDRSEALQCIRRGVVRPGSPAMEFMKSVCDDSYDRLLEPSMERELRTALTDMANEQAIHNFALNLRPLLMQPPVKGAVTMGLASVYSASKLAAEEFPQYDVNLRSAVSIARRLQDPLAELVKIDPKAIGVGQYQHDMPEKELDAALGGVVEACVNAVGVDLNTASAPLLKRVAGLNATTAKNIVAYREENGAFTSRAQIKKVPKLGPKAFEQCAGFLRVPESKQVLDRTGVHPESYDAAKKLAELLDVDLKNAGKPEMALLPDKLRAYGAEKAAAACGVGVPTLQDIVKELVKPGRDPRDELPAPILRTDVLELKDLKPGMVLSGTVRNVIDFGVFVDIGVHQDGLVHISQVSNKFIKHPSEVVAVGDVVKVAVLDVDQKRGRLSLTMKGVK